MEKLILVKPKGKQSYWPQDEFEDYKLYLFWLFLSEVPRNSPDWFISELKKESLMGINILQFDYQDNKIIISCEIDDPEIYAPIEIRLDVLYILIEKWVELVTKQVPIIILTHDRDQYDVQNG